MIKIYNTLSRKKEEFVPWTPGEVKMYVCGPTVYDLLHIGNFRGAIFFNFVRLWLEKRNFKVTFVYNYTDVDDKIIDRANAEKVEASSIAEKYIGEFKRDFAQLKLKEHSRNPKVSDYITQIVEFIEDLIKKEKAYVLGNDVYFNVSAFPDYGKLSNKKVDELLSGNRIEPNDKKRHPADFALWKASKENEPSWNSPWGKGRPGWHIECSAMCLHELGEVIDIHGGGLDLVFPHHENEVAQSEARIGRPFVKYWMHNNMLEFGNQKMSKSLGNVRTGRSFLEAYPPELLKFLMLSNHYRSTIDFSDENVDRMIFQLSRFYSAMAWANELKVGADKNALSEKEAAKVKIFEDLLFAKAAKVGEACDDDFNSAEALTHIFEVVRSFNQLSRKPGVVTNETRVISDLFLAWITGEGAPLALFQETPREFLHSLDDLLLKKKNVARTDVEKLVGERAKARASKDYKMSDELRKKLDEMGIAVMDQPSGSIWEVAKN